MLDDRSANGTFVNDRPISVLDLTDGDVLRAGRVVFRATSRSSRGPRLSRRAASPWSAGAVGWSR